MQDNHSGATSALEHTSPESRQNRAGLETLSPDLITRELGRLGRVAHELQRQHVVNVARLNDQVAWLLEGNAELVD